MSSGQVSLEFILVMGIALLMLASTLIIGSYQLTQAADDVALEGVIDVANSIQYELLTAASVSDGYERTFQAPKTIRGKPYSVTIAQGQNASIITVSTGRWTQSVRTPQCTGTLQAGTNTIRKQGGQITCNS